MKLILTLFVIAQFVCFNNAISSCKPNNYKNSKQKQQHRLCLYVGEHGLLEAQVVICGPDQDCDDPKTYPCTNSRSVIVPMKGEVPLPQCSGEGNHTANECNQYYACEHPDWSLFGIWEAHLRTCPPNQAFDATTGQCGPEELINCKNDSTTSQKTSAVPLILSTSDEYNATDSPKGTTDGDYEGTKTSSPIEDLNASTVETTNQAEFFEFILTDEPIFTSINNETLRTTEIENTQSNVESNSTVLTATSKTKEKTSTVDDIVTLFSTPSGYSTTVAKVPSTSSPTDYSTISSVATTNQAKVDELSLTDEPIFSFTDNETVTIVEIENTQPNAEGNSTILTATSKIKEKTSTVDDIATPFSTSSGYSPNVIKLPNTTSPTDYSTVSSVATTNQTKVDEFILTDKPIFTSINNETVTTAEMENIQPNVESNSTVLTTTSKTKEKISTLFSTPSEYRSTVTISTTDSTSTTDKEEEEISTPPNFIYSENEPSSTEKDNTSTLHSSNIENESTVSSTIAYFSVETLPEMYVNNISKTTQTTNSDTIHTHGFNTEKEIITTNNHIFNSTISKSTENTDYSTTSKSINIDTKNDNSTNWNTASAVFFEKGVTNPSKFPEFLNTTSSEPSKSVTYVSEEVTLLSTSAFSEKEPSGSTEYSGNITTLAPNLTNAISSNPKIMIIAIYALILFTTMTVSLCL